MTTTSHRDCAHPATKAARATCRKQRASLESSRALSIAEIREEYRAGADADLLLGMIARLGIDLDPELSLEELIASL